MRDRLLPYSFVISLIINFLWIVVVGNSDIFQEQATKNQLRVEHLHLVRPPIKKPTPPKKKLPPPPPKPVKFIPPPKVQPPVVRQIVPHPVAPQPTPRIEAPPVAANPNGNETVGPAEVNPTPTPPTPTPPQPQPEPQPQPQPQPQPPVIAPPPPPPPPPAPKKPKFPDRAEASPVTDIDANISSGIDVDLSTLSSTKIIVRYDIGADGKAFNFKILQSSGNDDLDNAAINACRKVRYLPAVQGGEPVVSRYTHEFDLSN